MRDTTPGEREQWDKELGVTTLWHLSDHDAQRLIAHVNKLEAEVDKLEMRLVAEEEIARLYREPCEFCGEGRLPTCACAHD